MCSGSFSGIIMLSFIILVVMRSWSDRLVLSTFTLCIDSGVFVITKSRILLFLRVFSLTCWLRRLFCMKFSSISAHICSVIFSPCPALNDIVIQSTNLKFRSPYSWHSLFGYFCKIDSILLMQLLNDETSVSLEFGGLYTPAIMRFSDLI